MTRRCSVIFRPFSWHSFSSREGMLLHPAVIPKRIIIVETKRPGHFRGRGAISEAWRGPSAAAALARARAEADRLGELAALLGIVRRDHRIVGRQVPAPPILLRRHV